MCAHLCVHVHKYDIVCAHVHVYVCVCTCVCVHVCVCVCKYDVSGSLSATIEYTFFGLSFFAAHANADAI